MNSPQNTETRTQKNSFTERELDILSCIVQGRTSKKAIATILNISPKTVAFHTQNIMQKINCTSWEYIPGFIKKTNMKEQLDLHFSKFNSVSESTISQDTSTSFLNIHAFLNYINKKKILLFSTILVIFSVFFFLLKKDTLNRSDINAMQADVAFSEIKHLIKRENLLQAIDEKMTHYNSEHLPTVCIIGMGGTGKTTLAKMWGKHFHKKKHDVFILEINAETKTSLSNGLKSLSEILAQTPEQKNELNCIENTKYNQEAKRLIFIQNNLKKQNNWLLIFDNVETYSDICDILPQNKSSWGNGHIIMTTRNAHLANLDQFNNDNVLRINHLTPEEQQTLFIKLRYSTISQPISDEEKRDIANFVTTLPPFPLDISIAARYMKCNALSFKEYSMQMEKQKEEFYDIQKDLLQETSTYIKTRYSILSLSFKQILEKNPQFSALLLMLTLVDSQNIPVQLFNSISDPIVCQSFLNELKKHSMILESNTKASYAVFSIHRSTQNLANVYMNKHFSFAQDNTAITKLGNTFASYLNELLEIENFQQISMIVPHSIHILKNQLIPSSIKGIISISLGWTYFCLGYDVKANQYLECGISFIKKGDQKSDRINPLSNLPVLSHTEQQKYSEDLHIVRATTYLGIIALRNGQLQKAKKLLEWCRPIYQLSDDYVGYTRVLTFLAHLYALLDHYDKARETFKQSIETCKKHSVRSANIARAYAFLGLLYKEEGRFKDAEKFFSCSIDSYQTEILKAWAIAHKAGYETEMGNFTKAQKMLEDTIAIYHKKNARHHVILGWVLPYLGTIYRKTGQYEKAQKLFEEAISIYNNARSHDNDMLNIGTPFPLVHLGKLYTKQGKYGQAEKLLLEAQKEHLKIFGPHNNRTVWGNIALAHLYAKKGVYKKALSITRDCLTYYNKILLPTHPKIGKLLSLQGWILTKTDQLEQAEQTLEKALKILQNHYKPNHLETTETLKRLAELYLEKNDFSKAITYMEENIAILKNNKHPDYSKNLTYLHEVKRKA